MPRAKRIHTRCISLITAGLLASAALCGCGGKDKDYSYDFSGITFDSSVAETAAETPPPVTYQTWKNNGYSVTVPSTWGILENTTNSSRFSPAGEKEAEDGSNTISVTHTHMDGVLSEDASEILRSLAVKYMGAEAPIGNISVWQNFPTWDGAAGGMRMRVSLVGKQDAVIYTETLDNETKNAHKDEIAAFEGAFALSAIPSEVAPQYPLSEIYPDLWSGIEAVSFGENEYPFPSKLSDMLTHDIVQYAPGQPLAADEYRWIRVIVKNDGGTFLLCLHNGGSAEADERKCDIVGIDMVRCFTGENIKVDDFESDGITFDAICGTFGKPVRQDNDLVTWELDGQDISAAFSTKDGSWTRFAITTLTDAEKEKREQAYEERVNSEQNGVNEWLNGGTAVGEFPVGGTI